MAERRPWDDDEAWTDDQVLAFFERESAQLQRVIRRDVRHLWVMNVSLTGFNLGLALVWGAVWWMDRAQWGYGLATGVFLWSGSYALRQLLRLWRQDRAGRP